MCFIVSGKLRKICSYDKIDKIYKKFNAFREKEHKDVDCIIDMADQIEKLLLMMDREVFYVNRKPEGEPKLGQYGLYPTLNVSGQRGDSSMGIISQEWFIGAVMNLLCWSDGSLSLATIAEKCKISIEKLAKVAEIMVQKGLLLKM